MSISYSFDSGRFVKNLLTLIGAGGGLACIYLYGYLCGCCKGRESQDTYTRLCVNDVLADEDSQLSDRAKNLLEQVVAS